MNRNPIRDYNPYLYIWGAQWIVQALLNYFWNMEPQSRGVTISLWSAVLLCVIAFVVRMARGKKRAELSRQVAGMAETGAGWPKRLSSRALLPSLLLLLASVGLLLYVRPESYLLFDLLRPLGLACLYGLVGVWLGRGLVYLGIWLFALTAVLSIWFLGFAPLVLLFFGGLSLFACALLIRLTAGFNPNNAS